jgi:hypothetical protein
MDYPSLREREEGLPRTKFKRTLLFQDNNNNNKIRNKWFHSKQDLNIISLHFSLFPRTVVVPSIGVMDLPMAPILTTLIPHQRDSRVTITIVTLVHRVLLPLILCLDKMSLQR